MFSEV